MTDGETGREARDRALIRARDAGEAFASARGGPDETDAALKYAGALAELDEACNRHLWDLAAQAFEDYGQR